MSGRKDGNFFLKTLRLLITLENLHLRHGLAYIGVMEKLALVVICTLSLLEALLISCLCQWTSRGNTG